MDWKEIDKNQISDSEVEEFKQDSLKKIRGITFVYVLIEFLCWQSGGLLYIIFVILFIPTLISLYQFLTTLHKDNSYWRNQLSKTWKYQSTLGKANIIRKLLFGIFGI